MPLSTENREKPFSLARKIFLFLAPGSTKLTTTFDDGTKVSGLNKSGYGGRGLFLYGERQEFELGCLSTLIKKGDSVVDIGANVGIYSMKCASIVGPEGKILSVEPYPFTAHRLLENSFENGFENVKIRVCCASNEDASAKFYMKSGMPNSFSLTRGEGCGVFDVATAKIDTMVEREGIEKVALIKIDAEGAEKEVLDGARTVISRDLPVIIIESGIAKDVELPKGYESYRVPTSHNRILLADNGERKGIVEKLGLEKKGMN